jgi:hypothetical protein
MNLATASSPTGDNLSAGVLFHVLWATGQPGSGWERFPSFVAAFNCAVVDQQPDEYEALRAQAEADFLRLAAVDDAFFFVTQLVCSTPRLPDVPA